MSRRSVFFKGIPVALYEPETIAYFNTLGIADDATVYFSATAYEKTGTQLWAAIETYVLALKTALSLTAGINNLSTRLGHLYPFIGGTAARHIVDLVSGTSKGTLSGGWTHDGSGALANGTNGYMNSGTNPNTLYGTNYYGYIGYNNAYTAGLLWGSAGSIGGADYDYSSINGVSLHGSFKSMTGVTTGYSSLYRTNATQIKYRKNGVLQTIAQNYAAATNNNVYIGAYNNLGSPGIYSNGKFQLRLIIKQPTDTEVANIETAIVTLQTTLNRL
jgi:hypothetical protein